MHTKESLLHDLESLGIKKGDTLLVRGDLGKIGRTKESLRKIIIDILCQAVGENGTIMGLSFTNSYWLFRHPKDYVFTSDTKSTAGSLVNLMLAHPNHLRSSHPVNSFVCIGEKSSELLNGHDVTAPNYQPVRKLIEYNGKMLLFGCANTSPGFTTAHLAQSDLGLSKKYLFKHFKGCHYYEGKVKKTYKMDEVGGCSSGFYKFYADYIRNEKLTTGYFGNAYSLLINAGEAYDIECEILKNNPLYALCNNRNCAMCRGGWLYNKKEMFFFYPAMICNKIWKKFCN